MLELEIVNKFTYLGVVFTSGVSSFETQKTLAGQAMKAIFCLNKHLFNFNTLRISHVLELFDKLISPILNYGSEVWGFYKSKDIETVHLHFCKKLLGVKQLGRVDFQSRRYVNIIKYWFKILYSDEKKYIKSVYNVMLRDLDFQPDKENWASLVRQLLSRLGFMDVWLAQGVGSIAIFINIFKQRVKDIVSQEWHARLENSSRARCYNQISSFNYQVYLDKLQIDKFRKKLMSVKVGFSQIRN